LMEPGPGVGPVAVRRRGGDAEGPGRLLDRQYLSGPGVRVTSVSSGRRQPQGGGQRTEGPRLQREGEEVWPRCCPPSS
jgi:hypothetical protein